MKFATIAQLKQLNPELIIWPLALAGLAFMHPEHAYPSICPLKWLGLTWCPGCGLGRSVSFSASRPSNRSLANTQIGRLCPGCPVAPGGNTRKPSI
ncbi:hypothetical protein DCM91_09615 [Chitinophaga costaii]|nr:hypothetical protein DCM91_09615 [Chitinophaga costaii]